MADRTYRWLLVTLAVIGLSADQVSKYGVFHWLYRDGQFADPSGTGNAHPVVPDRSEYRFEFIAQFDKDAPLCNCGFSFLQTISAPIMPRVNHGALFGIGQNHKGLANGIFATVSVAAAVAIVIWGTRRNTSRERGLMAALGLILGGTVGNLYDRLVFGGVRDFLHFYIRRDQQITFDWPVFNVADCCLVVGAALLLIQAVFVVPKPTEPAAAATDELAVSETPKQ
jgi:lipoprotein signal peptidase